MTSPEFEPQPQETVLKPKLWERQFLIPTRQDEFSRFREKLLKMDAGRALEIALFFSLLGLASTIYLRAHARKSPNLTAEGILPLSDHDQESFGIFWSKTYRKAIGFVINRVGFVHALDAHEIVANMYFKWLSEHWGKGMNYDAKPYPEQEDMLLKSLRNRIKNWHRDTSRRREVSLEGLYDEYNWDASTGELIEDEVIEKLSQEETEGLHQAITDFLEKSDRRRLLVAFLNMLKIPHKDIAEILGITTGAEKAIWFRNCLGLRKAVGKHE